MADRQPSRIEPRKLLIGFEKRWDVGGGNTKGLESFSDISAAVARGNLPAGRISMENNGHIAFTRVGRSKRPIMRDRSVQGVPEFFGNDFAHLFDVGRIAEISGKESCRERDN